MKLNRRPKIPRDLVKLPVSTSVPAYYLHRLETLAETSRKTFAAYVRDVLMQHVDER